MSALSFKINAETNKLKSFITMLERLRQVLADIPDSTKEFDVINRKIGEMEARVEQAMRKIAQMEQQAADTAARAAASVTTGTTSGGSTAGTAATQAETAAYHDLLGELKAANDEKTKAIAQIRLYSNEIARLKADVTALNKEEQQNGQLSAKKRAQVLDAAVSIEEYKQEISQLRRELANQIKLEQTAIGSINEMSQALTRMRAVYKNLSAADREGAQGQTMLKNIESLDTKIKELDASMGVHTRNVGNYASGFNMLGFQIQQVARELPSLAYGPQIFFAAISNNLPMLADEISRAKKSVDELKKAGQTFTPVWKQIASSIFSWQTLLVAGVTILTLYGKEIVNWVSNLFTADKSLDSVIKNIDQFNNQVTASREELQREFRALSQAKKGTAEYALARQTIMDKYDKYLSKQRAEIQNLEDMRGAYEVLLRSVTATSVAKGLEAANNSATEEFNASMEEAFEGIQAKFIAKFGKEEGVAYFTRFREGLQSGVPELEKAAKEIYKKFNKESIVETTTMVGNRPVVTKSIKVTNTLSEAVNKATKIREKYNDVLSANKIAMDTLLDMYNISVKDIGQDSETTEDIVEQKKKEISEIEKIVAKTPEEVAARNKKLEAAQKELKVLENLGLATKEQIELDNIRKQIQREMRDAGFEARQAEIDVMPEGIDKNIAQIELDYQKREAAIADGAERIRELQKKELIRGQRLLIAARQQAIKALKNKEWDTAFLAEAGIKDPKTYLDDQLEAWNEYYMKYGTILEKIQATKEYYDRKISLAKDAGTAEALRVEKDAAMAALEVEGSDFVNSLISKTKEDIEKLKNKIKAALKTLEDEFNKLPSSDSDQGDDLRNKINVLRAQLSAINELAPVSDEEHSESFEKWRKLYSVLTKIEGQFNDIGEAAGGAMGEVISTASKITTSALQMIDSIKTLAENSAEGIETTGEAAATTIQKVERASVILAIIQAALKIIQSIASIFGDTETSMERNIREAQELNEELRVMNERARLNADVFKTIFGEDAFGNYTNNVTALTDAMNAYQATMDKITNRGKEKVGGLGTGKYDTGLANLWKDDFIWESVSESVANMMNQVRHSTLFRSAKYKKLKDVVPELFEESGVLNMQALKEFVEGNSDTFKHLTKENQAYLKELVNNWETYEEAIKAVNDYLNEMFGELGSTLTDALVDSFEQGTNAADAFGEAAGNMLKNLAKQVLYTATIGPEIEKAQKKIDAINRDLSLSDEERYNALAGVVDTMLDDVLAQQKVGQELWERLKQAAEERGLQWDEEAAGQEATSRGFQAMSQDTGDELNGRFTDIQGKVTDIRGYVMAMAQTGGIITAINNIATLGDKIDRMSVACYESLRFDAETLVEVREINSSTKNMDKTLARIEEGINSIKKNTESL